MAVLGTQPQRIKTLLATLIVAGIAVMVIAVLVDQTGYGMPRDFGSDQLLLVVAGLIVLLIGPLA